MANDKEITFTKEEVQEMIMDAFVKGENYGVTYGGWFNPTKEQRAEKAAMDCEIVYRKALIKKL